MQALLTIQSYPEILSRIAKELLLSWHFIRYDISSTVIPSTLFAIAAWHSQAAGDTAGLLLVVGRNVIYFWFYVLCFCITNQMLGFEEDRVNKPDRPLPSGMVTQIGAWRRWWVAMGIYTGMGILFGVPEWTVLWQAVILFHNRVGWDRSWISKNLAMSLGTLAMLAAAWQMVGPISPLIWQWVLVIAALVYIVIGVQDLRDVEGDLLLGRRTMPIAFGMDRTRWMLMFGFTLLPFIVWFGLLRPLGLNPVTAVTLAVLGGFSLYLAWRVLTFRTPRSDHVTYILGTYWYCMVVAAAIVVL